MRYESHGFFQEKINLFENSRKSYGYYWLKSLKLGKNVKLGYFASAKAGLLYNLLVLSESKNVLFVLEIYLDFWKCYFKSAQLSG